ncbi:hypothetical protein BDW74DRAFT_144257 [Aspergillus multicolor]|uniref:uncharacterized protein n=1 Tax=Aspergillus multicolor TaxID=41759 RepID=UPI003CCD228D
MSRGFVPVVLAIVMGVGTGYYTFQPMLRELHHNKGTIPGPPVGSQSLPTAQQAQEQQESAPTPTPTSDSKPTPTPTPAPASTAASTPTPSPKENGSGK